MIKRLFYLTLVLLFIFAAACSPTEETPSAGPADDPEEEPTNGVEAVSLRMAIPRDEGSLNPYTYVTGYPGHNLLLLIYDTVFQLDENNIPKPWLVTGHEVDAEGINWNFTLHDGITWHDGTPLTAEDIKFSFEYYGAHSHSRWTNAVSAIEEVVVEDDLSFRIILSEPVPAFLANPLSDVPIIPEHIWQDVSDPDSLTDHTGSGPYRITEHVPDQTYRLQANTDYFLGKPAVEEIGMIIIEDQTATFTALRVGDIDFASRSLQPELVEDFAGEGETDIITGPGFTSSLLQINNEREPFNDPLVRKAISRAIDIDDLVDTVMLGYGTAGSPGYIHPDLPHYNPDVEHVYDPDEAAALLEEAGFIDTYGDREFELLTRSNDPLRVRTAEMIAENLNAVGINVSVQALDSATLDDLVWPEFDTSQGRDYDLSIWGWSAPVMIDPERLGGLFHSDLENRGTLNIGAYANSEVDTLAEELSVTVDPGRQQDIFNQLQVVLADTVPFVTLYYPDGIYAYRPDTYASWTYQNGQGVLNKLSFIDMP